MQIFSWFVKDFFNLENANKTIRLREFMNGNYMFVTTRDDINLKIEEFEEGYTISSNGAYLGVSNENKIFLYKSKRKETIFYPKIVDKPDLEVKKEIIQKPELSEKDDDGFPKITLKINTPVDNISFKISENPMINSSSLNDSNEDLKMKLLETKSSYFKNQNLLKFTSLTDPSPLKFESEGKKVTQSENATFSALCERKLNSNEVNYFEIQINSINPQNEWM
jgi:hypothetical protein